MASAQLFSVAQSPAGARCAWLRIVHSHAHMVLPVAATTSEYIEARTTGQSIGAALVAVMIALAGGVSASPEGRFSVYVFALACAISALSFFASMARIYNRRG